MRRITYLAGGGRCYYCGFELQLKKGGRLRRDWLLMSKRRLLMVEDHALPKGRGGTDDQSNMLSSCFLCNSAKAGLTVDEFRFCRGLRARNLSFSFWAEGESRQRDWICCHSRSFEKALFRLNYPDGIRAYGRGKLAPIQTAGT